MKKKKSRVAELKGKHPLCSFLSWLIATQYVHVTTEDAEELSLLPV